jgi:hypothetical protein
LTAFPNPFNSATEIQFDLPVSGLVSLDVLNLMGQTVSTLKNEILPAGHHAILFDANGLTSGVYLCRLTTGSESLSKKIILIK